MEELPSYLDYTSNSPQAPTKGRTITICEEFSVDGHMQCQPPTDVVVDWHGGMQFGYHWLHNSERTGILPYNCGWKYADRVR